MTGTPVTFSRPATQWAVESLLLDDLSVVTLIDCNGKSWPLMGGMAPLMGGEGVFAQKIKGLHAPFAHVDQQGAHQIGVDYLDSTYDKAEIDITLTLQGRTIGGRRRVVREWIDGWAPEETCRLVWFTTQLGHWWVNLRPLQANTDELTMGDALAFTDVNWTARADFPLWQSFDSTSPKLVASDSTTLAAAPDPLTGYVSPPNFLPLWNRGTEKNWPRYIAQGPGIFTFGDNGSTSGRTITISLAAGETVLIPTIPNRNRITDVVSGAPVFKKLKGRFATPVPKGKAVRVPVTVTGATPGVTSVIGTLTPWRRWPE